MMIWRCRS